MNQNQYYLPQSSTPPSQTPMLTQDINQVFSDWLIPSQDLLKQEDLQDIFGLFSPPLTASPASDNESSMPSCDFVTLFPDMANTNAPPPKPVPVQSNKRRLAPLMPKTMNVPIAPRPSQFNTPVIQKRRLDDEGADVAIKRQKNTDAARRSRLKKIMKMETLESQVKDLEADNSRLTTRVAVLESEKGALASKEKSLEERIRVLETQLSEAHRALTTIRS